MGRALSFGFVSVCLAAVSLVGCSKSSSPDDAGAPDVRPDVRLDIQGFDAPRVDIEGFDVGPEPDAARDSGSDVQSCEPVICGAGCQTIVENGCESCFCPMNACALDSDCVIGTLTGVCCPSCARAFTQSDADDNTCVIEQYTPQRAECMALACEEIPCPAIDCQRPVRAECTGGSCTLTAECAPGDVLTRFGCAPRCTANTDCVVRTHRAECCPGCEAVMHAQLAEELPCFYERGEAVEPECQPDASLCTAGCPPIACEDIAAAICNVGTGLCAAALPPG